MDNGECPIASLEEDGGDEANVKERRGAGSRFERNEG